MAAEEFVHWNLHTAAAPAVPDDESWTAQPHLIPMQFSEGAAPTLPTLTFRWEFGSMNRAHRTTPDGTLDYREPVSLQYQYVLLKRDDDSKHWIGFIRDEGVVEWAYEDDGEGGLRVTGGTQTFTAYGLEYFLGRQQISGSSSRQADRSTRPFAYNAGSGDGRDVDQAKRANRQPPEDAEADPYDPLEFSFETDAVEWTAAAIVKHLLAEQCPRDQDDVAAPITYYLDENAIPYLNWFKPTVRVEGRSLLQVLDEVISRRRGLVWWFTTGVADDELVGVISVTSMNDAALTMPEDEELPAAASQVTLDDPSVYPLLTAPQISRDGSRRYHSVRVRGARRTATFSAYGAAVDTGVGGYVFTHDIDSRIEGAWSTDDQEDYELGVSLTDPDYGTLLDEEKQTRNDKFRQASRFERVWQYFSVDAVGNLSPIINQQTGSITGYIPITSRRVARVQRLTAMRVGVDYADATAPVANGTIENGEEFVRPFALAYLPKAANFLCLTLGDDDAGWRRLHDLHSHAELGYDTGATSEDAYERKFPFGGELTPIAGEPGFILNLHGTMPHALNAGYIGTLEPSKYGDEGLAWTGLLVTVTCEWDCYCEAVWPVVPPDASPIEELLIQVGDRARFDWLAEGTVFDLTRNGDIRQVATAGAIRDDRKLCEQIAKLAHNWYSSDRAQVLLTFTGGEQPFEVGDLLTTIGTGAVQQTVNATVSQIAYDLERGGIQVNCGYPEVDFGSLA